MPTITGKSTQLAQTPVLSPLATRLERLQALLVLLRPLSLANATGQNGEAIANDKIGSLGGMECVDCSDYKVLIGSWRKAMKWTPGLDCGLSVMLASVLSTKLVGEQLWVKVISPPSAGKTTLLEGLAINTKYVLSKSSIRGFHSGYKTPDGADNSLIARVNGMTLATKDGDTLLKAPNLPQILSEARDIYDKTSRTHYRNAESNDYSGIRMTWLLCGTSALREIDESELGARFLDCVIMDEIDDEFEDEVGWRAANQEDRNMCIESDGDATTQYSPETVEAMQLTGGYVTFLRENAVDLLSQVTSSEPALRHCARLAKFVAFMRARPAKKGDELGEREFSARLVKQHVRLAKCLAVVLNRKALDEEVMRRVTKVAMDTARGQTLQIVEHLAKAEHGMTVSSIALMTSRTEGKTRDMLRFLKQIGVSELITIAPRAGVRSSQKLWTLTERMRKLCSDVEAES